MARTRPQARPVLALLSLIALAAAAIGPAATVRPASAATGCPGISGYVYYDQNFNGIKDADEPGIPGSLVELRNAAGVMVGSTVSDSNGYYQFNNDLTANKTPLTATRTIIFPAAVTDWAATREAARFDPSLGTLTSIDVVHTATITSSLKAESLDSDPTTVTGTVSGTLTLTGPGGKTFSVTPNVAVGSFDAAAYDGVSDFAGPSGHDFGEHTATDSTTTTITDAATLAVYTGTGSVSFTEKAAASSHTTGGGNVLNQVNTTAGGQVVVTYHYVPLTCLNPGNYTIVQKTQPPGYSDGYETRGNDSPLPNTIGTDTIPITLTTTDLPNNNFGELKASISGYVYYDANDNGLKESGEPGIPGTTVTLTGTDSNGQGVNKTTATNSAGYYEFPGLAGGTYVLTETQPSGYLDGKDTIGSQGGKTKNDQFYDIPLPGGANGINNNFGELLPPGETPTLTNTSVPNQPTGTGTPGNPSGKTQTPGGPTKTPIDTTEGAKTPGVPGTGGGFTSHTQFNIALAALALLAVSGWLAYIGAGKRRLAESAIDDEDDGLGPDEP